MKRWAWNIFCALSLLILATSVTLWVSGHWQGEVIAHKKQWMEVRNERRITRFLGYGLGWSQGSAGIFYFNEGLDVEAAPIGWHFEFNRFMQPLHEADSPGDRLNIHWAAFQLKYEAAERNELFDREFYLFFPLWPFLLFGLPPLLWWRSRRRRSAQGFPIQPSTPDAKDVGTADERR